MKIKKTILRLIRIIQFNTICKIKGHNNYYGKYHNGFKKGKKLFRNSYNRVPNRWCFKLGLILSLSKSKPKDKIYE